MDPSIETSASPSAPASHHHDDKNQDLDPATFLKSIRELSERREREDLERYRKLEEEVEKSRAERARKKAVGAGATHVHSASFAGGVDQQQRYTERRPSVSPTKARSAQEVLSIRSARTESIRTPPPPPPLGPSTASTDLAMDGNRAGPPSSTKDIPEFKGFSSGRGSGTPSASTPAHTTDPSSRPSPSASSLARSGTLSWQQRRPQSRGASRPTSVIGSEDSGHTRNTSVEQPEPSRDQIAASLGSRDPSWFRQTADRGTGSAAYRKSKNEPSSTGQSLASSRRVLPGLSRDTSTEPSRRASPAPSESVRSETASLPTSARDSGIASSRVSTTPSISTPSKADLKSLLAEDEAQRQASPMSDHTSSTGGEQRGGEQQQAGLSRNLSMSSSQARLTGATERPSSPTKGMGGFVQSAMMKRSDSVSKRWSAQPGASLSRQNSTVSTRSGYNGLQGSHSMPRLEPTPSSREMSNEPASRPTSSSSNLTALAQQRDTDDGFVKPALPHHSRSKSVASTYGTTAEDTATSPPSSPSKRFSPTKSSWIESALTRPESPKPSAARNAQPRWMANIAKAKAERASAESTPRTGTTKPAEEVSRPSSPVKTTPFGPSLLRSSSSRSLAATPRSSTPPVMKTPIVTAQETSAPDEPSLCRPAKPSDSEVEKAPAPETGTELTNPLLDTPKIRTQSQSDSKEPSARSATLPPEPAAVKPTVDLLTSRSITSPSPSTPAKPKPETPAKSPTPTKPQIDFRSTLRSRPAGETKPQGTPEFLSRFGQLRKTQPEKYVAPDVLKDNITRGKADLARTGGPVKTPRRDELKESLLAKKEDWKKAKEEGTELPGQVHERKTSGLPVTPPKPEALAKRELLGRQSAVRTAVSPEKGREATPEAVARHGNLRDESKPEPAPVKQPSVAAPEQVKFESLSKQQSAPAVIEHTPATETSRLAARFNPGLAGILARGPPSANPSNTPSRSGSPVVPQRAATLPSEGASEASSEGPLQDVRKGRAKGPKKRRGGTSATTASEEALTTHEPLSVELRSELKEEEQPPLSVPAYKPRAPLGSAASLMMASLEKSSTTPAVGEVSQKPVTPAKPSPTFTRPQQAGQVPPKPVTPAQPSSGLAQPQERGLQKPATPAKSLAFSFKPARTVHEPAKSDIAKPARTAQDPAKSDVPDFGGFRSRNRAPPTPKAEDNKENSHETLPSVKSAASFWGRQPSPKKADAPPQILLPSQRDEEAVMRSAGLLASSYSRPSSSNGSSNGLGISVEKRGNDSLATPPGSAGLPPKPAKPSRVVSGQLQEASVNKGVSRLMPSAQPSTDAERLLARTFGMVPTSEVPLTIDVRAVVSEVQSQHAEDAKTLRRNTQEVLPDGSIKALPQQEEYTVFDESVYVCSHAYLTPGGVKKTQVYVWSGSAASQSAVEHAQTAGKKLAREGGSLPVNLITQGHEDKPFLQAIGGILVTRRGSRMGAPKQYMLCGRKHLGHITFDEVDFDLPSLCAGFVYLISYPVTLQQTRLYLWKGSACSTEEISAARLAAMDLSERGEIVEVDQGAEFASFLKIFGPGTTKSGVPKSAGIWLQKGGAPDRFTVRLYRVQEAEQKVGLFASFLSRRPSWGSRPPSRSPSRDGSEVKCEAKHICPFTQTDLEAEGIYVLDACSELYVLVGPLFASVMESVRTVLLAQTLRFAVEYASICAEEDGEGPAEGMEGHVVFSGVPQDVKMLFRHWEQGKGLWGTAGLMAGSRGPRGDEVMMVGLAEVVKAVCK